jgi:hypothetical protein
VQLTRLLRLLECTYSQQLAVQECAGLAMVVPENVTRRAVVQTGAKLVYAAPLVAATMKVSAQGALALVSDHAGFGATAA